MRVLFAGGGTGGHLYPALAIARAVVRLRPDAKPFFIGAQRGIERDVLPKTEFPHQLLDLHPLYRSAPLSNWKTLRGSLGAWGAIRRLAAEERPRVVVGTGGYAAGLALAWAAVHRVPYVLQEQNSHPGLTVRFFSRWAREVYIGFPEAGPLLSPGRRTTLVDSGNPIEPPPAVRPSRAEARQKWSIQPDGKVLLVFGGSQGSRAMNEAVAKWLDRGLPDGLSLIWATGTATHGDYSSLESSRVRIRPYLAPIADAYAAADFALVRGGAMGTAELCAWGIPQIIVPLPSAAADHQTVNARALAAAGAGINLPQRELTVERLDAEVRELLGNPAKLDALARGAAGRARPEAAENIARRILDVIDRT
jgi:UDP-N-acetylglucosamine--N-acetylmuramyl-(pentapeptide) pyrophosphoryl-undecaprenol N-acetylglucosamine transferase